MSLRIVDNKDVKSPERFKALLLDTNNYSPFIRTLIQGIFYFDLEIISDISTLLTKLSKAPNILFLGDGNFDLDNLIKEVRVTVEHSETQIIVAVNELRTINSRGIYVIQSPITVESLVYAFETVLKKRIDEILYISRDRLYDGINESSNSIDTFWRPLMHDLFGYVNYIRGYRELLLRGNFGEEDIKDFKRRVIEGYEGLINQLEAYRDFECIMNALINSAAADEKNGSLEKCLLENNPLCRLMALALLANNAPQRIDEIAYQAALDGDVNVRIAAIEIIGRKPNKYTLPFLMHSLNDSNTLIRETASMALSRAAKFYPDAITALIAAISEGTVEAAEAAANGLALLGTDEAVEALSRAVELRNEPSVLAQVAHAFGRIQSDSCREPLQRLAQHNNVNVSDAARSYKNFYENG